MTVGKPSQNSPFPPLFVESLLDLPVVERTALRDCFSKNIAETTKDLAAKKAEFQRIESDFQKLAKDRTATEAAYQQAISQRDGIEKILTGTVAPPAGAVRQTSQTLQVAQNIEKAACIRHEAASVPLVSLAQKVNALKSGLTDLGKRLKLADTSFLANIENVIDIWSDKNHLQASSDAAFIVMKTALSNNNPNALGALDRLEKSLEERKKTYQVFSLACQFYNQGVAQPIKKAKITEMHSRYLKELCKNLSDEDLEKIFGKADSSSRKKFNEILKYSTRDVVHVPSLTRYLGENPSIVNNLLKEIVSRLNEEREMINLKNPLGDYITVPSLDPLSSTDQDTLDTLLEAGSRPDPALANALIKVGDVNLANLILIHLTDDNPSSIIFKDESLKDMLVMIAISYHNASKSIPPKIIRKFINTEWEWNKLFTYSLLREVQAELQEHKDGNNKRDPITLDLGIPPLRIDQHLLNWGSYMDRTYLVAGTALTAAYATSHFSSSLAHSALLFAAWNAPKITGLTAIVEALKIGITGEYDNKNLVFSPMGLFCGGSALIGWQYFKATPFFEKNLSQIHLSSIKLPHVFKWKWRNHTPDQVTTAVLVKPPVAAATKPQREVQVIEPYFERPELPSVFDATRPLDPVSLASRVHSGVETIFTPVSLFYQAIDRKTQAMLGSEEETSAMFDYLCNKWDIDPTNVVHCSTMMAHLEALFNWGGRIPFICNITGSWRVTMGLIIGATSAIFGLMTMTFAKDEQTSLVGRTIVKKYAIQHGLGNIVRGMVESTSWLISIMANLPRDLLGQRFSYEGEVSSRFSLPFVIQDMALEVRKQLQVK